MIGIDTNILLRFFSSEPAEAEQAASARRLLKNEAPVLVGPIVLAEFAWTLKRTYKLDRASVHRFLESIASAPEFVLMFPEATERAIERFAKGPADFADYLIAESHAEAGCSTTATFDTDAAKSPLFTLLE